MSRFPPERCFSEPVGSVTVRQPLRRIPRLIGVLPTLPVRVFVFYL
jgi:hypothetical protein